MQNHCEENFYRCRGFCQAVEIKHPKLCGRQGWANSHCIVHLKLLKVMATRIQKPAHRVCGIKSRAATRRQSAALKPTAFRFFAKGANWIPCDSFTSWITLEILVVLRCRCGGGQHQHPAFLGGGYEDDALFDACDEMGICVWMDFLNLPARRIRPLTGSLWKMCVTSGHAIILRRL